MSGSSERTTIAVAICTYRRNEELGKLLTTLVECAEHVANDAAVGVVVVDDTPHGAARSVIEAFGGKFELGLTYRISGRQNISLARNMAVETAIQIANWTVMTDDDCEPVPEWLAALLQVQRRTGADAVTGSMIRRVPPDSPKWLTEEPFLELGLERPADRAEMTSAATFNTMISSDWLRRHPDVRFDPRLGVVGGEDMVFFRAARAAGLQIRYSELGFVYENEPPSRATLKYQLRLFFWHGNSSYISSVQSGIPPSRMVIHGAGSLLRALARPVTRAVRGESPQLRYCLASILHAAGKMIGPLGIRVDHR